MIDVVQHYKDGGPIMHVLLLMSIFMFTVTLERLIVIFVEKRKINPSQFLDNFVKSLEQSGDKMKAVDEAAQLCTQKGGTFAAIMLGACEKYKSGVAKKMESYQLKRWITDTVEETANVELPRLESHLGSLAVVSNVATLIGLFGTVIGLIMSFSAMANSPGGVKADEMAGGIAVALICTAGGLLVAVPSLVLYNLVKGHIHTYVLQLDESIRKIIDMLVD